jgi:hypothetical protein
MMHTERWRMFENNWLSTSSPLTYNFHSEISHICVLFAQAFKLEAKMHYSQFAKVKVNCPCASTEHHAMKAYWGSGVTAPRFIDLSSRRRSASRPGRFTSRKRAPGTH